MPYDIRQNYRGKSGYSVVSEDGSVRGTHRTRREAVEQQRALYAAESQTNKGFWGGLFTNNKAGK
jgi:hypothetical protein